MNISRRKLLSNSAASCIITLGAPSIFGASAALAGDGDGGQFDEKKLYAPDGPADHFIGNLDADAKVTVVEYASSTCPHCANFHINTFPKLKETYIDTNKIRFVLRPFVLNVLDAVVFMLAYKAGETSVEGYYEILNAYMKTQSQWANSDAPRDAILEIAKQYGFTEKSFDKVLTNQELFKGMERLREQASKEFDMHGTPSFYVNGKMLAGNRSFEDLAGAIDPLLS